MPSFLVLLVTVRYYPSKSQRLLAELLRCHIQILVVVKCDSQ